MGLVTFNIFLCNHVFNESFEKEITNVIINNKMTDLVNNKYKMKELSENSRIKLDNKIRKLTQDKIKSKSTKIKLRFGDKTEMKDFINAVHIYEDFYYYFKGTYSSFTNTLFDIKFNKLRHIMVDCPTFITIKRYQTTILNTWLSKLNFDKIKIKYECKHKYNYHYKNLYHRYSDFTVNIFELLEYDDVKNKMTISPKEFKEILIDKLICTKQSISKDYILFDNQISCVNTIKYIIMLQNLIDEWTILRSFGHYVPRPSTSLLNKNQIENKNNKRIKVNYPISMSLYKILVNKKLYLEKSNLIKLLKIIHVYFYHLCDNFRSSLIIKIINKIIH